MKVKVIDISPLGLDLRFNLELEPLNSRLVLPVEATPGEAVIAPPAYKFLVPPAAHTKLAKEGTGVHIHGDVQGDYTTLCSRCGEAARGTLDVPIDITMRPESERKGADDDEDLHFGFYADEKIDCGSVAEEFLVLKLPFVVFCKPDCKGLCPSCGANLNTGMCTCERAPEGDERFAVLRKLKIQ